MGSNQLKVMLPRQESLLYVWFTKSDNFTQSNEVTWSESFTAYVSDTQVSEGAVVQRMWVFPTTLGQKIDLELDEFVPKVKEPEPSDNKDAFTFFNKTDQLYTCGICQHSLLVLEKPPVPINAFPIHGNNAIVVAPLPQIVLLFATSNFEPGTIIERQFSNALWLDFTYGTSATVSYDIDKGWDRSEWGQAKLLNAEDNLLQENVILGGF